MSTTSELMTEKQIRALKAIFIAFDELIDSPEEAVCVMITAAGIIKFLGFIPDYGAMCKVIDEISAKEA